jgi:hypothetical protein
VLVLDAVDDIAEVIAHVAKRFNGHGHNCGALTALLQARPSAVGSVHRNRVAGVPHF